MEFLRFGSSIPGGYWGCCACCIIQNFNVDPDTKASIQLVYGDGGNAVVRGREQVFAGPTYRDIFHQRLRSGTFDTRDMPNHAFIAILTEWQLTNTTGSKWLTILKEAGFEFIRTVGNSVYSGQSLASELPKNGGTNKNHIFMLVRNIGAGCSSNPFVPPKQWTDLPSSCPEAWERLTDTRDLAEKQFSAQTTIWDKIGPPKFLTESEVEKAGAPVILAGQRLPHAGPEPKAQREKDKKPAAASPFGAVPPAPGQYKL